MKINLDLDPQLSEDLDNLIELVFQESSSTVEASLQKHIFRQIQEQITDQQTQKYLESRGIRCPYCDSDNLEPVPPGIMQVDSEEAWMQMQCLDCQQTWDDIYQLTGFSKEHRR
jgi:DNA-directed RNA polymerase subunit RPC12/RpoP